jgi:hypothetical protein
MATTWKGFLAMLSQFFSPLWDRGIGDAQFSGNLCDRLATGLRQLHRLLFEFSRRDFLNFCHADPFLHLLEYISALATLPNRGKVKWS